MDHRIKPRTVWRYNKNESSNHSLYVFFSFLRLGETGGQDHRTVDLWDVYLCPPHSSHLPPGWGGGGQESREGGPSQSLRVAGHLCLSSLLEFVKCFLLLYCPGYSSSSLRRRERGFGTVLLPTEREGAALYSSLPSEGCVTFTYSSLRS
jgi:hypothetical protein